METFTYISPFDFRELLDEDGQFTHIPSVDGVRKAIQVLEESLKIKKRLEMNQAREDFIQNKYRELQAGADIRRILEECCFYGLDQ